MNIQTILIVDDEPKTRQGLKKTLELWSAGRFNILTAASGSEALDILDQQQVHLLITDIRMPEMSGLHLIEALESHSNKPVVIIISGYSEFEYAQHALRLGALNYLLKPLNKQKLIEAVEQALAVKEDRIRTGIMEKIMDTKLVDVAKEDEHTRSPIREAMRFIDEHIKEPLHLQEVAQHVHLNPSYFSALFKEQTKLTFIEYVTRNRLQLAKHLLVNTNMPIVEIAEEVGYQTAKYFIKLFKEYEGLTPSQYRRTMADGKNKI